MSVVEASRSSRRLLVVLCNPILDILATVPDSFLTKHRIEPGRASIATGPQHASICKDLLDNYKVSYIAGGSGQNTARVCQWMLSPQLQVSFMGAVGKDNERNRMHQEATKNGLAVHYVDTDQATGTCAALVSDSSGERTLLAHLSAAQLFKVIIITLICFYSSFSVVTCIACTITSLFSSFFSFPIQKSWLI
jgi:adenosine kinase